MHHWTQRRSLFGALRKVTLHGFLENNIMIRAISEKFYDQFHDHESQE